MGQDFDGSGQVNLADLSLLAGNYMKMSLVEVLSLTGGSNPLSLINLKLKAMVSMPWFFVATVETRPKL